jgi:hypothetical protein
LNCGKKKPVDQPGWLVLDIAKVEMGIGADDHPVKNRASYLSARDEQHWKQAAVRVEAGVAK